MERYVLKFTHSKGFIDENDNTFVCTEVCEDGFGLIAYAASETPVIEVAGHLIDKAKKTFDGMYGEDL